MKKYLGIALALLLLLSCVSADSRPRGVIAVNGFNGGRSQFNPASLGDGGEYPTLDLMKISGTWTHVTGGSAIEPSELDSNGYPLAIVGGGYQKLVFLPSQLSRPGNYKLTWTGGGTIGLSGATLATGSLSTSGCTIAITANNATQITVSITATTGLSDLKMFHVDDEVDILAGNIVGKQFKQRFKTEMRIGVIRYLDWMGSNSNGANLSTLTTWASRRPTGYHSFSAQEQKPSIYAATPATASGALNSDYALSFNDPIYGNGAPQDKQAITMRFGTSMTSEKASVTFDSATNIISWTNTALANGMLVAFWDDSGGGTLPANISMFQHFYVINRTPTTIQISATPGGSAYAFGTNGSGITGNIVPTLILNAAGGAIPIRNYKGTPVGNANRPQSGVFATLVYDAAINQWFKFGGDTEVGNQFAQSGAPPEFMVQFAAELGMHPYFVMPAFAADPITDFYPNLATYTKTNGPSWMIPRFEGPNELWNTAAGFMQTGYAENKAYVYSVATGNSAWVGSINNWYGRSMSQIGQSIAGVYGLGNLGTKYHVIVGVQTVAFVTLPQTSQNPRITAALYVSTQGGIAATNYVSHVANAQYITPSNYNDPSETTLATSYNGISIRGTISGSVLTITSTVTGAGTSVGGITVGQNIYGQGIAQGTTIASFGTGTGFTGTYNLSQAVATNITSGQDMVVAGDLSAEPTTYVNDYLTDASAFANLSYIATCYNNLATWAVGIKPSLKMTGYEGGYSPDYTFTQSRQLVGILRMGGKSAAALQAITATNYANFMAAGPAAGTISEFPSLFLGGGAVPSINAWAVYENVYVPMIGPDPPPQAAAIAVFNANWLLKRDLDPTSNDNDPMWLEKAA